MSLVIDQAAREAIGRILRDQPVPGDGGLFLGVLKAIREEVQGRLMADCALQAEWGRRKLAHDFIEVFELELERVHTPKPTDAHGGLEPGRDGSGSASSRFGVSGARRNTRRHGPAGEHGRSGYSDAEPDGAS